MRPLLVPVATRPALVYLPVPARRKRRDSAEFSLGGDAYVVVPGLHAAPRGLGARIAEWSRRVRRLLGDASFRALAAVALTGFAWLCEQGGA
jgi:hypothetical protein